MSTAEQLLTEMQGESGGAESLLSEIMQYSDFIPIGSLPEDYPGGQLPPDQPMTQSMQQAQPQEFTTGDYLKGAAETAATMATGATTGTLGYTGNLLRQLVEELSSGQFGSQEAAQRIAQAAMQGMQMGTYAPQTPAGQQMAQGLGELAEPLVALPPAAAGFSGPLRASTSAVAPIAGATGRALLSADFDGALANAAQAMRPIINRNSQEFGTLSVGAAQVPDALQRIYRAQELDVPINLTLGQAMRRQDVMQDEQRMAAIGTQGLPLRERWDEQRLRMQQNVDAIIDNTDASAFDPMGVGESVFKSLDNKVKVDKANIRELYNKARESGGLDQNVNLDDLSDYLNINRSQREENGIMIKVQRELDAMEVSDGDFAENSLSLGSMNLNQAEQVRRYINQNTNWENANDSRIASDMKRLIDSSTEGLGNEDYKAARAARLQLAKDFEDFALLKQIVGTKRGSSERAIAVESLLENKILSKSASTESVRKLQSVLFSAGEDGKQAWRDMKAGTAGYIKSKMLQNQYDEQGTEYIAAAKFKNAVRDLDKLGKLELILGYKDAEKIRTLEEAARVIATTPSNVVNNSNTAIMLAGLVDAATFATSGIPAPVFSLIRYIGNRWQNKKLQRDIERHLEPLVTLEDN